MRHGRGVPEKSKDFFGSIKRIFTELDRYRVLLIVSLLLAAISSILAIVSPGRLSKLADAITDGVGVNKTNMEVVFNNLYSHGELESYTLDGVTISIEDQYKLLTLLKDANMEDQTEMIKVLDNAPDSIKEVVLSKLNMNLIMRLALILAIIYVASALFSYITSLITAYISNYSARDLRNKVSIKINKLPLKYFDNNQVGDVLSRVTNDVDTVSQSLNNSLATLVSSLTMFIGSIVMMFVTNWTMAITAILSTFIGFIAMFIILSKSQKYFSMRQKELGKLNSHIEEVYSGLLVVKAYNGKKTADKEFDQLNRSVYKANMMSQFLSGLMQPLMSFVGNFGYVAVCVVGAILVTKGYITFGVIVAFMIYVRLFTNPLSQIAQALTQLQSTAAAGERVFEFLDEEEMDDESNFKQRLLPKNVKGNIEFKNVKFGYSEDKTIIKNFSAKVKPGNKVAIVGPTGAGKTTIVNLLMKFYNINDGDIIIDGKSIKELKREDIHKLFTMVLQDTWLFNGTIKENIKFNRKHVTDQDIIKALDTVGLKHFVSTLPNGINTELSESDSISSGQKQLLTIARGMIEDAPFLILDEATSNVDTRTEELVQKAMDKLMKNHTSFIIAHRLSTIKNADLILVLDDGNIVEMGTHKELINKNGYYASLYNSQFEL
ncbi:MAG: ABC transporter ATP-binding protein/permease [Bacilli bacterium]|nr:ABC transporter ATP-binding protein/permease [Bacilli bacterium]